MIIFDENGIGKCPYCNKYVSYFDRYCIKCGKLLPLPPNVEGLIPQLEIDEVWPCNHDEEERKLNNELEDLRDNYCSICGKKL